MGEIGSDFWNVPVGSKKNCLFDNATWFSSGRAALRAILKQIRRDADVPVLKVALP